MQVRDGIRDRVKFREGMAEETQSRDEGIDWPWRGEEWGQGRTGGQRHEARSPRMMTAIVSSIKQ